MCPSNISAFWSYGSLLGVCLGTQIVTGLFLTMYYVSNIDLAYDSVVYITRDVNFGWLIRMIHSNGASLFFLVMYFHVGRRIYYCSYSLVHV